MSEAKNAATLKPFNASDWHVGIVVGKFNRPITKSMADQAVKRLTGDYKLKKENVIVVEVAGAADMPAVLETLARNDLNRCLIAIGAIIKGETYHFDYVAKIATDAVREVAIKHAKPVGFGLLTTETEAQAKERVPHAKDYVDAAMHAVQSIEEIKR